MSDVFIAFFQFEPLFEDFAQGIDTQYRYCDFDCDFDSDPDFVCDVDTDQDSCTFQLRCHANYRARPKKLA